MATDKDKNKKDTDKPDAKTSAPDKSVRDKVSGGKAGTGKQGPGQTGGSKARKSGLGFRFWAWLVVFLAIGIGYVTWPMWRAPALDSLRANLPLIADYLPPSEPAADGSVTFEQAAPVTETAPVFAAAPEPDDAAKAEPETPAPVEASTPTPEMPAPTSVPGDENAADRIAALENAISVMAEQIVVLTAKVEDQNAALAAQAAQAAELSATATASADALANAPAPVDTAARETSLALLSLVQVQTDMAAGQAYDGGLAALTRTLGGDDELAAPIETLGQYAEAGVRTHAQLQAAFRATARAVAEAIAQGELTAMGETVTRETPGWLARIWEKMSSLVVIRRVGTIEGTEGPRAALAAAEAAVEAGDLEGALGALSALGGAPSDAALPWTRDVMARLNADRAFQQLKTALLARGTSE